jgi:hypothetical protein
MMTLGPSDGGRSEGMVTRSEWMDGILPRGLLMVTLGLTDRGGINEGELGRGITAGDIYNVTSVSSFTTSRGRTALETDDLRDGKSDGSVEIDSSKRDPLSRMSVLIEIDETVDTEEGVLVRMTGCRSGGSVGIGSGVAVKARSEGEGTVGGDGVADIDTDIVTSVTVPEDDE